METIFGVKAALLFLFQAKCDEEKEWLLRESVCELAFQLAELMHLFFRWLPPFGSAPR